METRSIQVSVQSFSDIPPEIQKMMNDMPGTIIRTGGVSYLQSGNQVFFCETSPEGTALLNRILRADASENDVSREEAALRAAVNGSADISLLRRFHIGEHEQRCAVLLRFSQFTDRDLLSEMIPIEEKDRMIIMENGDAVFLLHMSHRTQDEVAEFAAAAAETVESEAGVTCFAGVGRPADSLENVSSSYLDAKTALFTGMRHRIPGRVYVYSRLALERIADSIPAEKAEKLKQEMISGQSEKILTAENLETVRAFFRNDLNLSTTARQLFIHRNTLIYRMDKIRKATGLDLRKFEDAVVFRMLMSISEKKA